jgi:hypothetical protein
VVDQVVYLELLELLELQILEAAVAVDQLLVELQLVEQAALE